MLKSLNVSSWISEEAMAEEIKKQVKDDKSLLKDGKYSYYIDISALDEENLKDYAEDVGADYGKLTDPDNLSGIIIDTISYQDMAAGKFVETKAIRTQVGKSIDLVERLPGEKSEEKEINSGVIIRNGQAFIPLRSVFEKMGATLKWDASNKTVTISQTEADKQPVTISINYISGEVYLNNIPVSLSNHPFILASTAYLPLRFISESLGGK